MITRAQKARLGLFLIGSVLLLLSIIGFMVGRKFIEKVDYYTIEFDSTVSGLEVGAPVKYNGVKVGRVDKIIIDPTDPAVVIVTVSLQEGTPIKEDTLAIPASMGITGLRFIELTRGTRDSEFILPGGKIRAGQSTFDTLSDRAEAITAKIETLLDNLTKLTGDENRALLGEILVNLDNITKQVELLIAENRALLKQVLESSLGITQQTSELLTSIQNEIRTTFELVNAFIKRITRAIDQARIDQISKRTISFIEHLDQLVQDPKLMTFLEKSNELAENSNKLVLSSNKMVLDTNKLISDINLTVLHSKEQLMAMLAYLLESAQNLVDFSQMLKENPSIILSGPSIEEREME